MMNRDAEVPILSWRESEEKWPLGLKLLAKISKPGLEGSPGREFPDSLPVAQRRKTNSPPNRLLPV